MTGQSALVERREEWRRRVAEFRASGQSGLAWCAAQGIKPHLLYYWVKRFPPTEKAAGDGETQWLPIDVSDSCGRRPNGCGLWVRVGNAVVEVAPGFNPQLLADVVRTLTGLC